MSKIIQCVEGHYYDKDQNVKCPFCGVGPIESPNPPGVGKDERTERYVPRQHEEKTQMYTAGEPQPKAGKRPQRPGNPDITIAVWSKAGGMDPVVGWLVCHEGSNQGRDYRIRSGYNTVGRDTSSQICIAGDDTIARIEHARIFFDLKNARFHLIAGTGGRSGVYVNGDVVLQSTVMAPYDIVEIGATKLMFVPFCGDRFRWDTNKSIEKAKEPRRPDDEDWENTRGVS